MHPDIRTTYWPKPGPSREFDWEAVTDNYDLGSPIGLGRTEEAAVDDLIERIGDRDETEGAIWAERVAEERAAHGQFGVGA